MKLSVWAGVLCWITIAVGSVPVTAQNSEDDPRGAFLLTRRKPAGTGTSSGQPVPGKAKGAGAGSLSSAIGLGCTLYKKAPDGRAIRVPLSEVFFPDDAVRLMIEPNIDGYLYVFHMENNGAPQMIFPDVRLNSGANRVKQHVPYEVPSSQGPLPWFYFDDNAATEHLYIVLARKPLARAPAGASLLARCSAPRANCLWQPDSVTWNEILAGAQAPKHAHSNRETDVAQTATEREAIDRGLGLQLKAPGPTLVQMNTSTKTPSLIVAVSLTHKKQAGTGKDNQ